MKVTGALPRAGEPGVFRCTPEDGDDLWELYSLIAAGDRVQALTVRKVAVGSESGGDTERVRLKVTLVVEACELDGAEGADGGALRVKGRNATECDAIKLGAFHTLELAVGRAVAVEKGKWDAASAGRAASAAHPSAGAAVAALLVEDGRACLLLVGRSSTRTVWRHEAAVPRKRGAATEAAASRALAKFHAASAAALLSKGALATVKCLLLAGPGFAKDALLAFLKAEAPRSAHAEAPHLVSLLAGRTLLAQAACAAPHALAQALCDPRVAAAVADTAAAGDTASIAAFYATMGADPAKAFYGPGHVRAAAEAGAIGTLLLSDAMLRGCRAEDRAGWEELAKGVVSSGGVSRVFSSRHASGKALDALSGVAATLRFPLPHLECLEL